MLNNRCLLLFPLIFSLFHVAFGVDSDSLLSKGNKIFKTDPEKALEISSYIIQNSNKEISLGEGYYLKAKTFRYSLNDYNSALSNYYSAIDRFKSIKNEKGVAKSLKGVALSYFATSNFEYAAHYFSEELIYRENIGDEKYISDAYFNLGLSSLHLKRYDESIAYFRNAVDIDKTLNRDRGVLEAELNIGICQLRKDEFNLAIQTFNNLRKATEEYPYLNALVLNNLAESYSDIQQFDSTLSLLNKVQTTYSFQDHQTNQIRLLRDLAEVYLVKGNVDLSINFFERATRISAKVTDQIVLLECFKQLIVLYQQNGKEEMALSTKGRLADVATPLALQALEQKELHEAYKTRMVKHQRETQLIEREKLKLENTRLYLIIGLLVTAIVSYFIIQRLYRRKRSKEDTITYLKEKDAMLIHVTKKYKIDTTKIAQQLNEEYGRGFQTFGPD